MNGKIEKLEIEIERSKEKIADLQQKIRDMEKRKKELENEAYLEAVHELDMTPEEIIRFVRERRENPAAVPEGREDAHEQG